MNATPKQIGYLWGLARKRGIDGSLLREMTPAGSISKMNTVQASILIDALKCGKPPDYSRRPSGYHKRTPARPRPRLPSGVARMSTLEADLLRAKLIDEVRGLCGWSLARMEAWMAARHYKSHGGPMNVVRTTTDHVECIELLKAVRGRGQRAQERQRSASRERTA